MASCAAAATSKGSTNGDTRKLWRPSAPSVGEPHTRLSPPAAGPETLRPILPNPLALCKTEDVLHKWMCSHLDCHHVSLYQLYVQSPQTELNWIERGLQLDSLCWFGIQTQRLLSHVYLQKSSTLSKLFMHSWKVHEVPELNGLSHAWGEMWLFQSKGADSMSIESSSSSKFGDWKKFPSVITRIINAAWIVSRLLFKTML